MKMTERELADCLNYTGMERNLRRLAIKEKLDTPENIAMMCSLDVCKLILKRFEVVSHADEEITLVKHEDLDKYKSIVKFVCR